MAAILLTLSGVPLDDVLADYQVSHTYLWEFLRQRRAIYPDMPIWAGRSESWYLEQSLGELLRKNDGIGGYLEKMGVSLEQRGALVAKLLH